MFVFQSSTKEVIDDIGEVDEADIEDNTNGRKIDDEIDTVLSCTTFLKCKMCHSKADMLNDAFANCSKCSALTKISKCPVTSFTQVVIIDKEGKNHILTIF